jgi:hypothetical protein
MDFIRTLTLFSGVQEIKNSEECAFYIVLWMEWEGESLTERQRGGLGERLGDAKILSVVEKCKYDILPAAFMIC